MKQRIAFEQWNELNDEQKKQLKEWWEPQKGDWVYISTLSGEHLISERDDLWHQVKGEEQYSPLLSIGQMVEFMQSLNKDWCIPGDDWNSPDICDRMWGVVKWYLE